MKPIRILSLSVFAVMFAGCFSPAAAMKSGVPSVASNRLEARATCHHYRWSSRRHCTSAKTLRFSARPPLHYPQRYFGGTPHYEYAFPYYYGYRAPFYSHYGFYRYPLYRRPYWY